MTVLHKEFTKYNKEIKLTSARIDSLKKSRNDIKRKIRKWFKDNKPEDLQPKFHGQGSFEMGTTINPIPVYDENENKLLKYDLDYGVYFIEKEKEDSDNKKTIETWHNWVYSSVENHTDKNPIRKTTCIRVLFNDGHHIDLPIYYKKEGIIELAHKSKDWILSDPKEFYEWFNNKKNSQLERIVRYLKGWKNFHEWKNTNLKLPSGFELTILATNNYFEDDNDDTAFRETVRKMDEELSKGFKCLRPTTPKDHDVFEDYSESRKSQFLATLKSLLNDLDRTKQEKNFKTASEILRNNQFGERFPLGEDIEEETKSENLGKIISSTLIKPKPYGA
ncbi:cyclic GMP-AMP synthase DncV-like nucleotidyltransferase [Labilibaculum euxinus]